MSVSNQTNRSSAALAGVNLTLEPVEAICFSGLAKRFTEVFEAKTAWSTSTDKTKLLQKLFGTEASEASELNITYPYIFLTLGNVSVSETRGNLKYLNLYGQQTVVVSDDQKRSFRVKLIPTDFQVAIEFVTNSQREVRKFVNSWLFARQSGWLNFNVQYGHGLDFSIRSELESSVQIPVREADLANVQEYLLTATLTLQAFSSYPVLQEQQIADTIVQNSVLSAVETKGGVNALTGADVSTWAF
jgi:hypothetical protein